MSEKRTIEQLFNDIEELEGDYFLSEDLKAIRCFKAWLRLYLGPQELVDVDYEDEDIIVGPGQFIEADPSLEATERSILMKIKRIENPENDYRMDKVDKIELEMVKMDMKRIFGRLKQILEKSNK